MIRVIVEFKDGKRFDNLIRYIENNLVYGEAQEQVRVLGHHTADHMRKTIEIERINPARPDHKLENAITAETLNTTGGIEIGVGRIATLQTEAPYFEMIDVGATYITKKTHVVPLTYFADINQFGGWKTYKESPTQGFITFKEGSSHTIRGIHYIEKAVKYVELELNKLVVKLGSKFLDGMGKI